MGELFKTTETRVRFRTFVDAINHSYEDPQAWLSDFPPTPWNELRPDQPMRSSVYAAAYRDQAEEGEAHLVKIADRSVILVKQGSCVFVPTSSADSVASFGFSRCIAYNLRTAEGLVFAHITEHDETLFKMRERLTAIYGTGTERVYLPEVSADRLAELSTKAKSDLDSLKERLRNAKILTEFYHWSDFPPTSDPKEYSSGIIITQDRADVIPLFTEEANRDGYPIYCLDSGK
ncbi:hypothetical protein KBD34_00120 [Patescibacteria group bacterium]|nr:hypothetical protein [Patescibacteria group bacterium]